MREVRERVLRTLGVITARSGSVTVKDKNIKLLDGKPLMAHCIEACQGSKELTMFIVSTDSEKYADIAREYGALVPFLRPAELAEDVPSEMVIKHALTAMEDELGPGLISLFDATCTIQPTSPLICSEDIDNCIKAVKDFSFYDSAMTVCRVKELPQWMFTITKEGGYLEPFLTPTNAETKGAWGVRQTYTREYYVPNGMCYITKRELLLRDNRLIGKRCCPVVIPRIRSVDIDTEDDFKLAQAIIDSGLLA